MLIEDDKVKKLYFLLFKGYIDKETISYERSKLAISEDETKVVLCLKEKKTIRLL